MNWFTKEEFENAIETYHSSIKYPNLKGYRQNKYNRPHISQGTFAFVVMFEESVGNGSKDVAIRAFKSRVDHDSEKRYQAIHQTIKSLENEAKSYFIDYLYLKLGLSINGKEYPIIKMDWSPGQPLFEWLKINKNSKGALNKLINSLINLSVVLRRNKIAHGDIQPENIYIADSGETIKLIDYDGMYVEKLKDLKSTECGVASFQHPEREVKKPWTPDLDRFSLIVLFLALKSFIQKPDLVDDLDPKAYFPFRPNDFNYPEGSDLLHELSEFPELKKFIYDFKTICRAPIENVPTLEDFMRGENIPKVLERKSPQDHVASEDKDSRKEAHDYISIYPVVNANDFSIAIKHQESMVELIGRVVELKQSSVVGRPLNFILFSNWDGFAVKLLFWPELHLKSKIPNSDIENKWVSVTCWLERISYSHINAQLDDFDSFHIITENEAHRRLGHYLPKKNTSAAQSSVVSQKIDPLRDDNNQLPTHIPIEVKDASIFQKLFGWLND